MNPANLCRLWFDPNAAELRHQTLAHHDLRNSHPSAVGAIYL